MSRILFAWELGANYGHLSRQLPIALQLRQQGHQIFFVVRDTAVAALLLSPHGFAFIQAPFDIVGKRLPQPPVNYAEMLLAAGYADPATLSGLVQGWLNLIQLFKADLIVIDHAPTALFAAHLIGVPAIPIGTGFEIPPDSSPLPSIRPWETIPKDRLLRAEEYVLKRLNAIAASLGSPPLNRLHELFQGVGKLLVTFAELDHYGERAGESYAGSLFTGASGQAITWAAPDKPHIFAYLRSNVLGLEQLLKALSKLQAEVVVVAPGITPAQIGAHTKPDFRMITQPVQMDRLLQSTDLVVTTGGTGTVSQCLLVGIPLLIMPQNIEQYLMGRRIEALGAGLIAKQPSKEEDYAALLTQLLEPPCYRQAAQRFANRHLGFNTEQVVSQASLLIENVLKSHKKP